MPKVEFRFCLREIVVWGLKEGWRERDFALDMWERKEEGMSAGAAGFPAGFTTAVLTSVGSVSSLPDKLGDGGVCWDKRRRRAGGGPAGVRVRPGDVGRGSEGRMDGLWRMVDCGGLGSWGTKREGIVSGEDWRRLAAVGEGWVVTDVGGRTEGEMGGEDTDQRSSCEACIAQAKGNGGKSNPPSRLAPTVPLS